MNLYVKCLKEVTVNHMLHINRVFCSLHKSNRGGLILYAPLPSFEYWSARVAFMCAPPLEGVDLTVAKEGEAAVKDGK